jgi:NAD(P)-dependent dehydrogenase (short-subunit alcohol dehydrogenase family)
MLLRDLGGWICTFPAIAVPLPVVPFILLCCLSRVLQQLTPWEFRMINNAGVALESSNPKPIWDFSQEIWDKDIAINSTGVFLGCKYASAQMIKQSPLPCGDRGWILNISSIFGLQGSAYVAGYVASKHAVMGVTRAAALDCAPMRIHVNALCPGCEYLVLYPLLPSCDC